LRGFRGGDVPAKNRDERPRKKGGEEGLELIGPDLLKGYRGEEKEGSWGRRDSPGHCSRKGSRLQTLSRSAEEAYERKSEELESTSDEDVRIKRAKLLRPGRRGRRGETQPVRHRCSERGARWLEGRARLLRKDLILSTEVQRGD